MSIILSDMSFQEEIPNDPKWDQMSQKVRFMFHVSSPLRGIRGIHCNSSKTPCLFSSPSRYGITMYHQCEEPINNYCAHVMREFTNQKCWNLSTNNEANHCYTRGTLWPLDMQHHRSPRIVWTYPTPRPRNWNPTVTAVNKIYTLARVWISYYQWILSTSINHHWSSIHCQMSFEPWLFLDSPGLAKPSQA